MDKSEIPPYGSILGHKNFFLDFLVYIIPGLLFLVSTLLLIGGLICVYVYYVDNIDIAFLQSILKGPFVFFNVKYWIFLGVLFFSYVAGYLLYRQELDRPDYASFIRVRKKALKSNDWVLGDDDQTLADVVYPYSKLNIFLEKRGFSHLIPLIDKKIGSKQRSVTLIHKLKVKLSYYFPVQNRDIIKNEAHLRASSAMWHASTYILKLSYCCIGTLILLFLYLAFTSEMNFIGRALPLAYIPITLLIYGYVHKVQANNHMLHVSKERETTPESNNIKQQHEQDDKLLAGFFKYFLDFWVIFTAIIIVICIPLYCHCKPSLSNFSRIGLLLFYVSCILLPVCILFIKYFSKIILRRLNSHGEEFAERFRRSYIVYDRMPLFASLSIFIITSIIYCFSNSKEVQPQLGALAFYAIVVFSTLLSCLFAKHRIEATFHFQRVREIVYVLEAAYTVDELKKEKLYIY